MKALLILIKRQLVDNAAYFAIAAMTALVLASVIVMMALSEDHTNLSSYARMLFVATPLLVGIGSYALGFIQARTDMIRNIIPTLSVLPIGQVRIVLAQIIIGVCVIMTALILPTLTGTILWRLYSPPEWLFHPWIIDTFIGSTLTALACYLLGLRTGQRSSTSVSILSLLPLTLSLLLLVAIRGFGTPLLVILIPLIVALTLQCWNEQLIRPLKRISKGVIIMVCLCVTLSLSRQLCNGWLITMLNQDVRISPSGLLAPEIENEPNVTKPSYVIGSVKLSTPRSECLVCNLLPFRNYPRNRLHFQSCHYLLENSGMIKYFMSRRRGERVGYRNFQDPISIVHLDEVAGLLVHRRIQPNHRRDPDSWRWNNVVETYAGPEGVSNDPNAVGRFSSPTVYFEPGSPPLSWRRSPQPCIVYDKALKQFYGIDFYNQIVVKDPEQRDFSAEPFDVGLIRRSGQFSQASFYLPSTDSFRTRLPVNVYGGNAYLPIVDASGHIDILDLRPPGIIRPGGQPFRIRPLFSPKIPENIRPRGHLPAPRTLFGYGSSRVRDLLDYEVEVVSLIPNGARPANKLKTGLIGILAVSVSRQGFWTAVAVFDDKGNKIKSDSSEADLFDKSSTSMLALAKYGLESLHPPVLTFASFWTAYSFEARASHRAIFLMPNSFAAMVRDHQGNILVTLGILLLVMLPGLVLAGWLGYRVARDAATIGLSQRSRSFWLAATITFGLAGYITYRLSRPKVTLVNCANCGKGRRPDMDTCHHCNSKWDVPELTPPAWRVLEGSESGF